MVFIINSYSDFKEGWTFEFELNFYFQAFVSMLNKFKKSSTSLNMWYRMPLLGGLRAACGTFSAETSVCSRQAVFCQKTAGRLRRQLMPVSHGVQSAGGAAAPGCGWAEQGSERRKEWARAAVKKDWSRRERRITASINQAKSKRLIVCGRGLHYYYYYYLCIIYSMLLYNKCILLIWCIMWCCEAELLLPSQH